MSLRVPGKDAGDIGISGSDLVPPSPDLSESERTPGYPNLLDDPPSRDPVAGNPALGGATVPRRANLDRTDPLIEELLLSLSLRERIGQRFIAFVPGTHLFDGAGRAITTATPAGFILYPWNYDTADDVRDLVDDLQDIATAMTPGIELLICADQEGGRVSAFSFPDFADLPSAFELARHGDAEMVRAASYVTHSQLRGLGVNMNLAPVLDLYGTPDDSIIGDRSFGDDPHRVSALVDPYLAGAQAAGVISVAKHFPGHGTTTIDSHHNLPVVEKSLAELLARDLVPFVAAIDAGVDVVMTAHILFEAVDPFYPVTLSRAFVTNLLRRELGFGGLVMSDGLEMGAIRDEFSQAETLVRMFKNGVDLILLYNSYDVVEMVRLVEDLIETGEISEDDVNRGTRRVLALKQKHGLAHIGDQGEL